MPHLFFTLQREYLDACERDGNSMTDDNIEVDRDPNHTELVALRNRMDAAEAAIAELERTVVMLMHSLNTTQGFILRHTTAANPGVGGK